MAIEDEKIATRLIPVASVLCADFGPQSRRYNSNAAAHIFMRWTENMLRDKKPSLMTKKLKMKIPKLLLASGLTVFFCAKTAQAGVGIYQSFVVLNANGTGNAFYDAGASTANPDFQGANLGAMTSLILNGGEVDTYKNNSNGNGNVLSAYIDYRIYSGSPSGSFRESQIPFTSDLGGGNQEWQATGANINVLSGLGAGTYTLEIYFRTLDNNGGDNYSIYDSNGGLNYKATFTVVPEPVKLALAVFGGLMLAVGLGRRFVSKRAEAV